MHSTEETLDWLEGQRQSGSTTWKAKCLMLTRMARGLEAMFPSALAAQLATPMQYRITDVSKIRFGMIGYFDDPNDSNPFGHIVTFAGRGLDTVPVAYTNDAFISGGVSVVKMDFFPEEWGDKFQFASTWLNGVELDMPGEKPKPKLKPLGRARSLKKAIEIMERSRDHHRSEGHGRLVSALNRDIKELKETLNKFS